MSLSSSNKNHSKKKECGRDRDRLKATASESGGSSQCDTPPLVERDGSSSQGRFAGIGPDSVQCMAEQVGGDISAEAASNLAEDVSYKLRQVISTIALHSELMKKTSLDSWDVNTVFTLTDTGPVVGATSTHYAQFGDEKLCCPIEELINVSEFALTSQTFIYASHPTMSVEWITDEKSLNTNTNISVHLHNYYTKVARAILNLRKKPKEVAVADLMTNTRIGPIFPNLFNLAVLVLNDDNLNALNVPAKKPLQSNVLDMVDALCSNPCSLDTNIQQQFQRLFPVMVSNILGNGSLAEKMVAILTKITRTWPSFIMIGKGILFDYLSQGTKERLTAPMIKCVMALGRSALVECLGDFLDHLDDCIHTPRRNNAQSDLRDTILEVSTCLLRSEPNTYLEDFVMTDYTLYEMLGDSILPRRTIFPKKQKSCVSSHRADKQTDEEVSYSRPLRRPRLRRIETLRPTRPTLEGYRNSFFEPTRFYPRKRIHIRIRNCRMLPVNKLNNDIYSSNSNSCSNSNSNLLPTRVCDRGVLIAGGFMYRYKYKINRECQSAPHFAAMLL